jgi:hypothetical protein
MIDTRMRDYPKELVNARPRDSPLSWTFGKLSQKVSRYEMLRTNCNFRIDEDIGIDRFHSLSRMSNRLSRSRISTPGCNSAFQPFILSRYGCLTGSASPRRSNSFATDWNVRPSLAAFFLSCRKRVSSNTNVVLAIHKYDNSNTHKCTPARICMIWPILIPAILIIPLMESAPGRRAPEPGFWVRSTRD